MRRLRHCVLALILIIPAPAAAQNTLDSGFVACQNDTQCIKIDNKCGGIAINRSFMDDVAPIAQNIDCVKPITSSPKDVARCVGGACALVHLTDADFRNEWPKCVKGDGCAIVYDGCEDVSVNSKYANFVPQLKVCKAKSVPHDQDAYGKCVKNACVMKSYNPAQ